MNDLVKEKCGLLEKNRAKLSKEHPLENDLMLVVEGLLFTAAGKEVDTEKMAECRKILKSQTGFFSNMRAETELVITSKMSLSEDPEQYFHDLQTICEKAQEAKFKNNSYLILSGLLICDLGMQGDADVIIAKAKEIMDRMEQEHPILTSSGDTSYVMLLALSYKDVDTILKDLEEGYEYLKSTYKMGVDSNAIQGLCEVLAVTYGDMKSKCDRAARISAEFKKRKSSYNEDQAFSALGALVDIDLSPEEIVTEIIEVADYLKEKKVFTDKDISNKQRLMYSIFLVADACGKDTDVISNPVISNTISILTTRKVIQAISVAVQIALNVAPAVTEVVSSNTSGK
ncbi:MAG: DUF4003 family protein [Lachnospiraceae bacterium]|nr:DUF4003 family protein [Lachnospiraceae bacterium]